MINYLSILFCFVLTGCISTSNTQDLYVKFSDKITSDYIKHVRKNREFTLVGTGGRVTDEVQTISLILETVGFVDVPTARKVIIEQEEEFLARLNGMEEIRPYLIQYPSGTEAFELRIGFKDTNGEFVSPPHIALVSICDGKIFYKTFDTRNSSFTTVYSEPYEEAYRIVYGREKE